MQQHFNAQSQNSIRGAIDAQPTPVLQVDQQLDSVGYALGFLEDIAEALMCRLETVTVSLPFEPAKEGGVGLPLVPIAMRISSIEDRVRDVSRRLEHTLNLLQV